MKKLFFFIIFSMSVFSQVPTTYNLELYTGDNTAFQFLTSTDISTSRLLFVVKANDVIYSARLIEKKNSVYGGGDSEIKTEYYKVGRYRTFVYLEGSDTDTLDAEFYYYDLVKIDPADSTIQTTLYTGRIQFKHQVQSPYDNTYVDERAVFWIGSGTIQNETIIWDVATQTWMPSGDTLSVIVSVPDSVVFQSELAPYAPLTSPSFDGTVTMLNPPIIGLTQITASGDQINYLNTTTSNVQTQLNSKANNTLSNLGTTSINTNLIPATDYYIGSSTKAWSNVWSTLYTLQTFGNPYYTRLTANPSGSSKLITLPNQNGTVALTSDLANINNPDSLDDKAGSDYATKTITDSLAEDINVLPTVAETESIVNDSLNARMGTILDIDDLAVVKDYEPVMQDSSMVLYYNGAWNIFDFGDAMANVVVSLPDSIVYTSEIAGDSIIGTSSTLDSIITDYWAGTLGGNTIRTKTALDVIEMAYIDTFLIYWLDDAITIDSIKAESTDSVKIQIDIVDGNEEVSTDVFAYGGVLVNGTTTLTTFADNSLTANTKAYLYFTYIGDTAARLKLKIYWRYN